MMDHISVDSITRNLQDAGCSEDTISKFMEKINGEHLEQGLRLLENHRRSLLDAVHAEEKKIECLDYLVYLMTNQSGRDKNRKV